MLACGCMFVSSLSELAGTINDVLDLFTVALIKGLEEIRKRFFPFDGSTFFDRIPNQLGVSEVSDR